MSQKPGFSYTANNAIQERQEKARNRAGNPLRSLSTGAMGVAEQQVLDAFYGAHHQTPEYPQYDTLPALDPQLQSAELQRWQRDSQRMQQSVGHDLEQERARADRLAAEQDATKRQLAQARDEAALLAERVVAMQAALTAPLREKLCGTRGRFEYGWGQERVTECCAALDKSLDDLSGKLAAAVLLQADRADAVRRWCPAELPGGPPHAPPAWPQLVQGLSHGAPTAQQQRVAEVLLRGALVDELHAHVWGGLFHGLPQMGWPLFFAGGQRLDFGVLMQQAGGGRGDSCDGDFAEAALHFYRDAARLLHRQVEQLYLDGLHDDDAATPFLAGPSFAGDAGFAASDAVLQSQLQQQHSWPLAAAADAGQAPPQQADVRDQGRGNFSRQGSGMAQQGLSRQGSGLARQGSGLMRQGSRKSSGLLGGMLNRMFAPAPQPADHGQAALAGGAAAFCKHVASSMLRSTAPTAARGKGGGEGSVWLCALQVAADAIRLQYLVTAVHPELVVDVSRKGARHNADTADNRRNVNVAAGAVWTSRGSARGGALQAGPVELGTVLLNMLPMVSFANTGETVYKGKVCVASSGVQWAWNL